jgi:hypothetical protein
MRIAVMTLPLYKYEVLKMFSSVQSDMDSGFLVRTRVCVEAFTINFTILNFKYTSAC